MFRNQICRSRKATHTQKSAGAARLHIHRSISAEEPQGYNYRHGNTQYNMRKYQKSHLPREISWISTGQLTQSSQGRVGGRKMDINVQGFLLRLEPKSTTVILSCNSALRAPGTHGPTRVQGPTCKIQNVHLVWAGPPRCKIQNI